MKATLITSAVVDHIRSSVSHSVLLSIKCLQVAGEQQSIHRKKSLIFSAFPGKQGLKIIEYIKLKKRMKMFKKTFYE